MSFRARLLIALGAVALVPLVIIAIGVRWEMTGRLTAQYQQRVDALSAIAREDLTQESVSIASRLASLTDALSNDNRFRLGAIQGAAEERQYMLDYAEHAMRMTGLSMLQIQDSAGRILSSGHFRNEFDRLEPDLPTLLATIHDSAGKSVVERGAARAALVRARTPEGPILVLARVDSVQLGGRRFTLVGGVQVGEPFLRRLAREGELAVTLALPDGIISSDSALAADTTFVTSLIDSTHSVRQTSAAQDVLVATIPEPYIGTIKNGTRAVLPARLLITHSLTELRALRRSVDRWFLTAIAITAAAALLVSAWLAERISRPLRELAGKTERIDLDRLDVDFTTDRDDELGSLSRLLGAMTRRLRGSAAALRDAERRATVGDIARQVNHDIKNGLAPIRNVLRHLAQVAREHPDRLALVFTERRHTLDASINYLDTLARNYARLTPRLDLRPCDPNTIARDVANTAVVSDAVQLKLTLDERVPSVAVDPIVLRRILENLVTNAIDSLAGGAGTVTLATAAADGNVRITVTDTGTGMTQEQLNHAFDDFYTTKPRGTGLGLSIVRRLVTDLHGALRIDTEPGAGTTATITLPSPASPTSLASPPDRAGAAPLTTSDLEHS